MVVQQNKVNAQALLRPVSTDIPGMQVCAACSAFKLIVLANLVALQNYRDAAKMLPSVHVVLQHAQFNIV